MSRVTAAVLVASAALLASSGPLSAQTTCTPRTDGGYSCYDSSGNAVPRPGGGQNTHDDSASAPAPIPHSYSQIGNPTPTVPKTGGGHDAHDRPAAAPRIGGGTTGYDGRGNIITCVSRPGGGINCY